jgi:hypothetical protein
VEREKDNADTLRALRFAEKKLRVKDQHRVSREQQKERR